MGSFTQSIIIRPAALDGGPEKLLEELGYAKGRNKGYAFFVGATADCVLLHTHFAAQFFPSDPSQDRTFPRFREALFTRFPAADIVALSELEKVGHWGFAIYRDGVLVRRQYGCDVMEADEGARLAVEDAVIAKFRRVESDGHVFYKDGDDPEDDGLSEAGLGAVLVEEIGRFYAGFPLDVTSIPQHNRGSLFWLDPDTSQYWPDRPWWKFWG